MATVSGTFSAVGQSATLDVTSLGEDITISLSGGATATVTLEREKVPYAGVWQVIRTYYGDVETSFRQERKNERYRFNTIAYTTGTVTYSVSDGDKRIGTTLLTSEGVEVITYTQAGVQIPGDLSVVGTTTFTGALSPGTLELSSGSITDSSAAISFGDENLSTTGTLAAGVSTLDGIAGGDSALGIDGEAAAQGGSVTITGGTSSTAGNVGGTASLIGGTPGATSAGAAVAVTGGIGGATSGNGGAVTVTGGTGTNGDGDGGAVTIEGGLQNGSGAAGVLNLGTTNTDVINVGHSGATITLVAGQIGFPATQVPSADANTLDDYEEGTWTPVLAPASGSSQTYTLQIGSYTKIGRMVFLKGHMSINSLGDASGDIGIAGLPFPSSSDSNSLSSVNVGHGDSLAITAGHALGGFLNPNSSEISLRVWDAVTGTTAMQASELSAGGAVSFSVNYYI